MRVKRLRRVRLDGRLGGAVGRIATAQLQRDLALVRKERSVRQLRAAPYT
jgi:hypothetical protein